MPKIKELSNDQLEDYLDAYNAMLSTQPKNKEYLRKARCIEEALNRREQTGYDLDQPKKGFFKRLFSKKK
ncbi:MAG: hypothetical protein CME62_05330 [Halobacteriovoraceae bacterium]|nr:hypothetical protein [Halobacteriovoraceae bacterium]|tara:strand:- start:34073 stop:34282 length:210 start_codon:yes stop_codon:yes gene_type:complete